MTPQKRLANWRMAEGGDTRYIEIMGMLLNGWNAQAVADAFQTDEATIRVYEKALNGKLCRPMGECNGTIGRGRHKDGDLAALREEIARLYNARLTSREIADRLSVSQWTIKSQLKAMRSQGGWDLIRHRPGRKKNVYQNE